MTRHYSEADLLETYYTEPGESMPVMMHLAGCPDCATRYERLEKKLREAASCNTERPATFWARQRISIQRRVVASERPVWLAARWSRIAAAAAFAFALAGVSAYKGRPFSPQPVRTTSAAVHSSAPVTTTAAREEGVHDAWQSDEIAEFHNMVEWESWVPPAGGGDNTL